VITVTPDHDAASGLSATQRDELLRLLRDELHQAYRSLDLPADEAMADLRRRRARLGPVTTADVRRPTAPVVRPVDASGQGTDHGAAGDREVDDAQDGIDDPVHRPTISE